MLETSCHCGAVRLAISRKPQQLTDCNCSICRRYGALWAYYTRKSVRVVCEPADALAVYGWGERSLEFHHCRFCGCAMFHERAVKRGEETRLGINMRMAEPPVMAEVRVRRLDGASSWEFLD